MNAYKLLELIQPCYDTIEVRVVLMFGDHSLFLTATRGDRVVESYGDTFEDAVEMLASTTLKENLHATDD